MPTMDHMQPVYHATSPIAWRDLRVSHCCWHDVDAWTSEKVDPRPYSHDSSWRRPFCDDGRSWLPLVDSYV